MDYKETDLKIEFGDNHHFNLQQSKNRDKFFKGICNGEINENNIIRYMNKYTRKPLYRRILGKGKRIIKKIIK